MTVLVVGGGITGLSSAYTLSRLGIPTTLLEASDRLGGKVRTERVDGLLIESGPDSFVGYRPAAVELARELGLGDAIIRPLEPRVVHVRVGGRFVRLPDGMGLVLPTRLRPFIETDMFSPLEKALMARDLLMPRSKGDRDVSIGSFLRRRLGAAVVERLAGPLIGGVYGAGIDDLSLDAVLPQLRVAERDHRSLLLASLAEGRGRRGRSSASPFVTMAGGTGQLVEALADAVRSSPAVDVRLDSAAVSLDLAPGGRPVVKLHGGETIHADGLILATPAPAAAALLSAIAPAAAAGLRSIPYGSTGVVTLAYGDRQFDEKPRDHGFLVADGERLRSGEPMTISGCTVSSAKWAGRAPEGTVLLRAFVPSRASAILDRSDEEVAAAARRDIEATMGVHGEPVLVRVARWPNAMPQYTVGHLDRVRAAFEALAATPSIVLAGAAYTGVGLPECIRQGRTAAERVAGLVGRVAGGEAGGAERVA